VLSLVVSSPNGKARVRRLPSLHFGKAAIFADRDPVRVVEEVSKCIDAIISASSRPTYFMDPCEIGGRQGLYVRDLYSRSGYRARLKKKGARFSKDRFPRFADDGRFECDDWGKFDPSFVVTGFDPDDPQEIGTMPPGLMAFLLTTHRIGGLAKEELSRLIAFCRQVEAVSASDPSTVIGHLHSRQR
jgi:hypothetical protein